RSELLVHNSTALFEVIPNVGISGERVRLVSDGAFHCPVITGECDPPSVRFGSQPATVVSANLPNEIVVLAPSADPLTTVDVTVEIGIPRTRKNAYHYAHSFAPDVAFLEPVLIPVYFAGPGAHGADWQSELTVRNDNDHPLTPVPNPFYTACFPICDTRLQARTSMRITPGNEGLVTGYVFHLPRQAADGVHLNLLVRDLSRQAEALGAEIPVVREHEFQEGPFGIVNVPVDGRYRVDLRLYSIDGAGAMRLVIRSMTSDTPLVATNLLPLSTTLFLADLAQQYPQIRGAGAVRIEFIPVNPTIGRFWAFATVTNNETQHVTVISPQ
ncbi:MAG TPA: hypothetical protein VFT12_02605, partial [Thermoanaerobaculia bacterium]|nr:hypothetical protein [Thermoanaerobaculia bacterium]